MKLKQNTKYTTIAVYTVLVFAACLIVYKFAFTWDDTTVFLGNIITIMTPFITALLVAYFISPMVNFLEARVLDQVHIKKHYLKSAKMKRIISIILSYLFVLGTLSILLSIVIPQVVDSVKEISTKLPTYVEDVIEWARVSRFSIGNEIYSIDFKIVDGYIAEYLPSTLSQFTDFVGSFAPDIISFTTGLATGFLNILFGFIIAVYLIFNKEAYLSSTRKVITALAPPTESIDSLFTTLRESHVIFSSFFCWQVN